MSRSTLREKVNVEDALYSRTEAAEPRRGKLSGSSSAEDALWVPGSIYWSVKQLPDPSEPTESSCGALRQHPTLRFSTDYKRNCCGPNCIIRKDCEIPWVMDANRCRKLNNAEHLANRTNPSAARQLEDAWRFRKSVLLEVQLPPTIIGCCGWTVPRMKS